VDRRFEGVEDRFKGIDDHFKVVASRFDGLNIRFDALHRLILVVGGGMIGSFLVVTAALVATQL
jgi:hypothetical protein